MHVVLLFAEVPKESNILGILHLRCFGIACVLCEKGVRRELNRRRRVGVLFALPHLDRAAQAAR